MDNSETSNSEVSSQRKEMKGPSFSFDPKIFLSKKEDKNQVNEEKNTNNVEKTCEKTQINKEEVKEKELNPREKLKQKLQMQKMMRQNKGTLKRMLDSKIKSWFLIYEK